MFAIVFAIVCVGAVLGDERVVLYGRSSGKNSHTHHSPPLIFLFLNLTNFITAPAPYVEVNGAKVDPSTLVTFTIVLRQRNIDQLKNVLYEVSNPKSPKYGKYWTKDQVDLCHL
jgi:subtilase family serine protease